MKRTFISALALMCAISSGYAKDKKKAVEEEGYVFTPVKELKVTPVKNQNRTGTCWCFSTLSFLESELIRMGKGEHDLPKCIL